MRPAANRVFGGDAARLTAAELRTLAGAAVADVAVTTIAGVEYVTFVAGDEAPLLDAVAALSSGFALFEQEDGGLLRPVELPLVERYDDDLVTTQRYLGKTNETFTRLLLNLGFAAAGLAPGRDRAVVLDPLCGRGTTLTQALRYGADALGIDIDPKDTRAFATFLTTWLRDKRVKHQVDATAGRHRFRVTIGAKGAAAADERRVVDVITGDTVAAAPAFGRGRVDVIAADLPYGVQHGARTAGGAQGAAALRRRPDELLAAALPAWRPLLRPGGAVALSWNRNVLRRDDLLGLLAAAGYDATSIGDDGAFEHRVDRAIVRDLVVARRPAAPGGR